MHVSKRLDGTRVGAPTRALLATVTPGSDVLRAFGHAAIVFEHPAADVAPGSGRVAYSYGGYTLPQVALRLNGWDDPWDALGSLALECVLPIVRGTTHARKMCQGLADLEDGLAPAQALALEELRLTRDQLSALHARITRDFERVEPGLGEKGSYFYHHFRNNCATRLRDQIFAVLEDEPVRRSSYEAGSSSLEQVVEASWADALRAHPGGIRLFPEHLRPEVQAFLPGAPMVSQSPGDLLCVLRVALLRLRTLPAFEVGEGAALLAEASRALDDEVTRPRSFGETLFTPKRLRDALADWLTPVGRGAGFRSTEIDSRHRIGV